MNLAQVDIIAFDHDIFRIAEHIMVMPKFMDCRGVIIIIPVRRIKNKRIIKIIQTDGKSGICLAPRRIHVIEPVLFHIIKCLRHFRVNLLQIRTVKRKSLGRLRLRHQIQG